MANSSPIILISSQHVQRVTKDQCVSTCWMQSCLTSRSNHLVSCRAHMDNWLTQHRGGGSGVLLGRAICQGPWAWASCIFLLGMARMPSLVWSLPGPFLRVVFAVSDLKRWPLEKDQTHDRSLGKHAFRRFSVPWLYHKPTAYKASTRIL